MLALAPGVPVIRSSLRMMPPAPRGLLGLDPSGGHHHREVTDRPPEVVSVHREECTVDETEQYVPCPEGSWRDHVVQLTAMLRPIIDEEMDPSDRVIAIDNLYEEMCDWHLLAMLFMFTGFASGLGINSAELYEASKSLQDRDPRTLGTPHP